MCAPVVPPTVASGHFEIVTKGNRTDVPFEAEDIAADAGLKCKLRSTLARAGLYQIDRVQTQDLYQAYRRLFGS